MEIGLYTYSVLKSRLVGGGGNDDGVASKVLPGRPEKIPTGLNDAELPTPPLPTPALDGRVVCWMSRFENPVCCLSSKSLLPVDVTDERFFFPMFSSV